MKNRQRQKRQGVAAPVIEMQLAVLQETPKEVAEVWGVPISEQLKDRAMEYFEKQLQRDHGGQLTQQVAEALCTRDRNVQRMVQELKQVRASDLAWPWMAHKKKQGQSIGEGYRPELGPLRTTQVLWELHAQAITGWNMDVRQLITREVLRKVVLSRKVLESVQRFKAKGRAMRNNVPEQELLNMEI